MKIQKQIYTRLVQATVAAHPNEACCILTKNNTKVWELIPKKRSAGFFMLDPKDGQFFKILKKDGVPSAIFHSHPCQAIPSGTDRKYMEGLNMWCKIYKKPEIPWLIMSNKMRLRAWKINEEIEVNIS